MKKNQISVDAETGEFLPTSSPIIKRQFNRSNHLKDYERNSMPSKTIPGQSMSIADMVARHRKGLPIDESKGALYHEGDSVIQDLDNMDLIDRQAYVDSIADALVEVKMRIAASAKTEAEKDYVEKFNAAVQDELKKINSRNQITDLKNE